MKSIKIILTVVLTVPLFVVSALLLNPATALAVGCPNGGTAETQAECPSDLQSGANAARGDSVKKCLFANNKTGSDACASGIFTTIVNVLLFIIGAISVIMIIYGGIRYTTSGGEAKNVTAAKNTIIYAVVGLVVAILAYAIVNFVITKLVS